MWQPASPLIREQYGSSTGAVVSAINRISTAPPATREQYSVRFLQVLLLSHPRRSSSNHDKQDHYCPGSQIHNLKIPWGNVPFVWKNLLLLCLLCEQFSKKLKKSLANCIICKIYCRVVFRTVWAFCPSWTSTLEPTFMNKYLQTLFRQQP